MHEKLKKKNGDRQTWYSWYATKKNT